MCIIIVAKFSESCNQTNFTRFTYPYPRLHVDCEITMYMYNITYVQA